jgi:hypothetical protein
MAGFLPFFPQGYTNDSRSIADLAPNDWRESAHGRDSGHQNASASHPRPNCTAKAHFTQAKLLISLGERH